MLGESLVNLDDENLDVDALTAALVNSDDNFGEGHENFLDPLDESLLVSPEAAATPTHAATSKSESGSVAGAAQVGERTTPWTMIYNLDSHIRHPRPFFLDSTQPVFAPQDCAGVSASRARASHFNDDQKPRVKPKAPTLSVLLKRDDDSDEDGEKKAAEKAAYSAMLDAAEKVSSDPKEQKKQRRLIRNRMSAQLHRERKKAYIDKLEAEIKVRDGTIEDLRRENAQLRRMLAAQGALHGEACAGSLSDSSAAAQEELGNVSEGSSEGTRTPPPPLWSTAKRGGHFDEGSDASKKKAARLAPGSLLLAVCCLAAFRLPLFERELSFASITSGHPAWRTPSPAWAPSSAEGQSAGLSAARRPGHRPGGRVLMSLGHGRSSKEELGDDDSLALSVVHAALPSSLDDPNRRERSLPGRREGGILLNTSYFFCPQTIQTVEGARRMDLERLMNSTPTERRRLGRQRRQQENRRQQESDAKSVVPVSRRVVGELPVRTAASLAITNLLVKHQVKDWDGDDFSGENKTVGSVGGQLVVRRPPHVHAIHQPTPREQTGGSEGDAKVPFPNLMLIVPSSSLEGLSGAAASFDGQSNWVEVGCQMQSARFVHF
jgi:hypothetical protein